MARYEHLPIYHKAMEMAVYLQTVVRKFSRYDKYTIGQELRDLSRRILMLVIKANSSRDKGQDLTELVQTCELLKTMLVFAKETKAFGNFTSFQHAVGLAVTISKQSEGWLKSSRNSQNHPPVLGPGR